MLTCICGRSFKRKTGFTLHSKQCKKSISDKLAGGTGSPPVLDNVDVAREELKNSILPMAIETLKAALQGTPMKECRIRASISILKLTGADRPKLKVNDVVTVNFGEDQDPENMFEEKDDEDSSEDGGVANISAVV